MAPLRTENYAARLRKGPKILFIRHIRKQLEHPASEFIYKPINQHIYAMQ